MPNQICEMIVAKAKPNGPEWAKAVSTVKPYADVDLKVPSRPSDEEIQAKQVAFVDQWVRALAPGVAGKAITAADVKVATRHRYVATTDGGLQRLFKLSFRLFLPGVSTTPKAVEYWMNKAKLFDGADSAWDKSVYSATRKMCMVFGRKSATDPTPLTPTEDLETLDPLDYVIQHVEPFTPEHQPWATLAIPAVHAAVPSGLGLNDSSEDEDMAEASEDADFRMVRPMLQAMGFSQVQLSGCPSREDGGIKFYNFTCSNRSDCPCCHQPHDSNRWFVQVVPGRSLSVKNHSSRCRIIDLFADRPCDPFTKALVDRPSLADRNKDYAERFSTIGQEYLFPYVQDGKDFLAFNGSRWEAVKVSKREPPPGPPSTLEGPEQWVC